VPRLPWVVVFVLAASAQAAPPDKAAPSAETIFRSLWAKRQIVQAGSIKLYLVEMDPSQARKSGSTPALKLKVLKPVGWQEESFKPREIQAQVHVGGSRQLADRTDSKRYLALMRHFSAGNMDRWMPIHLGAGGGLAYFLAADGYSDAFWAALNDLVFHVGKAKPEGRFQRMLDDIAGKDPQVRDLAACFAGVNGWGYRDDSTTAGQPDAFARALLSANEPKVRGWMAKAYSACSADLLPRDPALLAKVLDHKDKDVRTPALKGGLRSAAARADALVGVIRPRLTGPGCVAERRSLVLDALRAWGKHAAAFVPALKEITLGKAAPPATDLDRVVALRLCLDAECEGSEKLILDTLDTVPSAVALKYAVDHKIYAVVPAIIRAARADRLMRPGRSSWDDSYGAALVLLTRRFPEGTFEQFSKWWASVEQAGAAQAAVRDGFCDPAARAKARELIAQLGSDRYKVRQAAMEGLRKLGPGAMPELKAASRSSDPEVAASAAGALGDVEAKFRRIAERLDAQARDERAGKSFLPMAQ